MLYYLFLGLIAVITLIIAIWLPVKPQETDETVDVVDEEIPTVRPIKAIKVGDTEYEVHTGPGKGMYYLKNGKKYYLTSKQKESIYEI